MAQDQNPPNDNSSNNSSNNNGWFTAADIIKVKGFLIEENFIFRKLRREKRKGKKGVFTENFILATLGKLSFIDFELEKIEIILENQDSIVVNEKKEKELKELIQKLKVNKRLIWEDINRAIALKMIKTPSFLPLTSKKEKVLTPKEPEKKEKDISDFFNLEKFKRKGN